ncbi:hypothetical protein BT96DRAFT_1026737 [Gymnopus androsaceus JB14]|uniref:F-box domain-containing protein n=1 Tax=Gymnopus androsaceus JB14 TaxID=1447944 RepID=A0A6A4GI11_9AGAR|nr:hypothetical protein BT96DRAFT_1026737 [Gymnopus androsaceus JB14]
MKDKKRTSAHELHSSPSSTTYNLYSDKATLLKCALVGRAWVRSSQRGIFRQIILDFSSITDIDGYLKTTERLVAVFDAQPRLASYVRSLELGGLWFMETRLDAATASVVQRLSNAELTEILRYPSLTQHLKVVDVSDVSYPDWNLPAEITGTPSRSIHLEELKLDHSPPFIDWLLHDSCPFEVWNLQSLCLYGHFLYSKIIGLMQYIGGNFRNLKINLRFSKAEEFENHLPNLRTLHLAYLEQGISFATPVPKIQALFRPLLNQDGNGFPLQHLFIDLRLEQARKVGVHP